MNNHTPGPWSIKDGFIMASDTFVAHTHWIEDTAGERIANSHLISAAPELLAVCRMISDQSIPWKVIEQEAALAISKATGGE